MGKGSIQMHIRIDAEVKDNKRTILFEDIASHHVNEDQLKQLLKDSVHGNWKVDPKSGAAIGASLYDILNGSGGKLQSLISDAGQTGAELNLNLDIPYGLNSLPFELVKNNTFLLHENNPVIHIIRKVTDRNRYQQREPEPRSLRVLFVACSPIDLPYDSVLNFEKEEDLIQSSVEKLPVDLTIEDSGNLEGIREALIENEIFDVIHITGHSGHDQKLGPIFYMESEIGALEKVTPSMLWEALRDNLPRVLFLSGCSTGKSNKVNETEFFAFQMVKQGISTVLGWGLPVSDTGATRLTIELYKYFGMGKSIAESVSLSRQAMADFYHPWPLLRLFSDNSPLNALIARGQPIRRRHTRKLKYKVLEDSQVKVLADGFVGRRREIQKGVRILRGFEDEDGNAKSGLIIRGPAGIGKSCLAGKLIERFKDKELIVIHGELKAADLLLKLKKLFDRKRILDGLRILKAELEFKDKIKDLFSHVFPELPIMFYFDDFEQNLVPKQGRYEMGPGIIPVLSPLLEALEWSEGKTSLIITSRYPFILEHDGEDLYNKLGEITLMAFRDADLKKKNAELLSILNSDHKEMYLELGHGNPRLLEWIELIAKEEDKYDIDALKKACDNQNEDFIKEYITDILARTEGTEFELFIQKASVYRKPVKASAFNTFGDDALLEKGVDLTLFEKEKASGHEAIYWVMPVIREQQWAKVDEDSQHEMHQEALTFYEQQIATDKEPDLNNLEEAIFHALVSNNIRTACKYSIRLGSHLDQLVLYRDSLKMQLSVAEKITDKVIDEAISEEDENVATLLNNLGMAYKTLGETTKAIEYYEKALRIDLNVFGDQHPKVAIRYNNLGSAYKTLGETTKAIEYFEKALRIFTTVYGENHPNTKTVNQNLEITIQEAKKG
ncbi:MAG: tetratricopeptide repeat protein [Desulfobacula sp.]|nr:tetratricopeptide repeat protein [Desulfobacula sp.]